MNKVAAFSWWRQGIVFWFAIAVSILLSIWIDARNAVLNPDAICYLLSAQTIGVSGFNAAMHLCDQAHWPFYSALIYTFVKVTHFSYAVSADVINAIFSAMTVATFILIVQEVGGSKRLLWFAAATILLAHEFNSLRESIIRDHGFWAFYLASLFFFFRFIKQPTWLHGTAWNISLLLASLFRIEGFVFLVLIPFSTWFYGQYSFRQRLTLFFMLHMPSIILAALAGVWLLIHPQQTLGQWGRLADFANQFHFGALRILERFQAMQTALQQYVLTTDSQRDGWIVTILLLILWYALSVIAVISWIYTFLIAYAWVQRSAQFTASDKLVLFFYASVNVLVTFVFFVEALFLSKRYLFALALLGMLWVPFALNDLWQQSLTSLRYKIATGIVALCIAVMAISGIVDFGYSKAYLHNAGTWLAANVPANATLYSNDYQVMYYSQHFGNEIFAKKLAYAQNNAIANGQWKQYDYVALRLSGNHDDQALENVVKEINLPPVQTFSNKRDDRVVIYKINK